MPRIGANPRELQQSPAAAGPFQQMPVPKGVPQQSAPQVQQDAPDDINVPLDDTAAPFSAFEIRNGTLEEILKPHNDDEATSLDFSQQTNLCDYLDEDYLTKLGSDIVEMVERDILERAPHRARFEKGLEMMGLIESDIDDGAFPGAATVIHPLLAEAVTQFWARGLGELFPPDGPAKARVPGKQTKELLDRGNRVAEYLNYEMTIEDEGYIDGSSRLLWNLPLTGNCYRKTYRDTMLNRTVGIFVGTDDLIVPAEATNLKSAPRFTHRMKKFENELRGLMIAGQYRDIELDEPQFLEEDAVNDLKNEAVDVAPDGEASDNPYEIFETCIDLELPGHEHVDASGQPTGLKRSYYVSVERNSQKVLSIYQGWKDGDEKFRRCVQITKYGFIPGFGFYDFGLFHMIGGLQAASTGALRVLLDGAATASLSGGFVSKNANIKGETMIVSPGEWKPVDATSEDLKNSFFPLPVKEPSQALFNLLGLLVQGGKSFAATTEAQTGQGDGKNVAVGTITKLIEQGEKVMSSIHRMAHRSLGHELLLRFELARDHAPEDGYPYDVAGDERTVFAEDFSKGVSIIPVSDPNIFSSSQRLAISQMVYEVASANPDKVNRTKAIRRLFEAARVPDVDDLIPEESDPQAYDPNGEIQAMLLGRPILVTPEQPHDQHLKVLWAFASNPQYGGNPEVQKQIGPTLLSTIGQHLAFGWVTHSRQLAGPQMGQMIGYMDPQTGQMQQAQMPPEFIAQVLAQIAPNMAQVPGLPALDNEDKKNDGQAEIIKAQVEAQSKQTELAMKQQEHDQKLQMKAEEHEFKKQELVAKVEMKQAENDMKLQVAQQKAAVDAQVQQQQAEQQAVMGQQQMAIQSQQMQQEAAMQSEQMQRESQMDQQRMHNENVQAEHEGQLREREAARNSKLDHLR